MISRPTISPVLAALAFALLANNAAVAQPYPSKPIRMVVPFPAGGGVDTTARVVAERLARALGQQVYVENRSGSGGVIGNEAAARSPADGYTVLVTSDAVTSTPHVLKVNIDPLQDLLPVIQLTRQPVVLAVHPSLGIASLAELVALAKQRPGMAYATSGIASPLSLAPQWFARIVGIKLETVPYRGGGPVVSDLLAGHVKIASLGSAPLMPHYRAGNIRLLAQTTEARSPALPDVPTYQEAGAKGLVLEQWFGVFVPAATPPAIAARLNAEINKVLGDGAVRQHFLQQAQELVGGSAEQFSGFVRQDFKKYARLIQELNIKAD